MEKANMRPTVTITSYSTLKRIERQQQQKLDTATRSELSTEFFKINNSSNSNYSGNNCNSNTDYQKNRHQADRSRVLIDLSQIKGPTGSVRGHKNVVRRSLEGIKMAYNRRLNIACAAPSTLIVPISANSNSSSSSSSASTSTSNSNDKGNQASLLSSFNRAGRSSLTNSLSQYIDCELYCREFLERLVEDEQNLCVAYTTTLGVIRRTFEDSKIMKSILNLNLIKYEERDIYLNQEYRIQLKMRMDTISVPALFVDGQHIGGVKELEIMNENGDLPKLLSKFKMTTATRAVCLCCGNAKFIACQSCHGSRKSTIHHFKFNSVALRCIKCDKNDGLVKCPVCCCDSSRIREEEEEEEGEGGAEEKEAAIVDESRASSKETEKENENRTSGGNVTAILAASDQNSNSPLMQDENNGLILIDENNNNNHSGSSSSTIKGKLKIFLNHDIGDEVSTC